MTTPDPVDFFERQFQRQVRDADFALNPFEQLALPYVAGSVLDLGCGLGSLSLEAARRDSFPAPEGTRKEFATVIVQKPQG